MKLSPHLLSVTIVPFLNDPVLGLPLTKRVSNLATVQTQPSLIPTYATSAGDFSTAARGWNSIGLQANPSTYQTAGFDFNDHYCAQQCDLMVLTLGFRLLLQRRLWLAYEMVVTSMDASCPTMPTAFTWYKSLAGLADHAHSQGYKVGPPTTRRLRRR